MTTSNRVAGLFVLFIGLEILVLSIATAMGLTWETKCRLLGFITVIAGMACTFYLHNLEKNNEY